MTSEPCFIYIDDHPASRRVMHLMLVEMMGYEHVIILEHAKDLMAHLDEMADDVDVIFTDLSLEETTGYEVLERVKAHPRYQDVRCVAVTASATSADLGKLKEAGFDGMIAKPLNPMTFPDLLKQLLAGEAIWELAEW